MTATRWSSPAAGEIEVSVFGPGRGETIVVHAPDGTWFVVDSLTSRYRGVKQAAARHYLNRLGVDRLWGVFLTHWHEDHTAGAADLIRAYANTLSVVGLPPAFGQREYGSFVTKRLHDDALTFHEVRDLVAVMEALEADAKGVRRVLLNDGTSLAPHGAPWRLDAIAPSVADVQVQLATLAKRVLEAPISEAYDVNACCAVLVFEAGADRVLLSSDLDVGATDDHGWRSIVRHHSSRLPSSCVKIGHHGSKTALHPPAWQLISASAPPRAVITPFPSRGGHLPREREVSWYRDQTRSLAITAPQHRARREPTARVGKVQLADTPFSEVVKTPSDAFESMGQVRFRKQLADPDFRVEVFPPAFEVPA